MSYEPFFIFFHQWRHSISRKFFITIFFRMLQPYPKEYRKWESKKREEEQKLKKIKPTSAPMETHPQVTQIIKRASHGGTPRPALISTQGPSCWVPKGCSLQRVAVIVVQTLSHVLLFATLGTATCQASLSFTIYQSLTHVHWVSDAIQPSHPLSSPSPPALSLSQHQGLFRRVSFLHQMAKVLEFQLQHQSLQWTPRNNLL